MNALKEILKGAVGQGRGERTATPERRPEWCCSACSATNFDTRRVCRDCGGARDGQKAMLQPARTNRGLGRAPALVITSDGPSRRVVAPQKPGQQAEALRQAAAVARRAGAPPEALAPLAAEERAARRRQLEARAAWPLEQARTAATRASEAVKTAETSLLAAQTRLDAAKLACEEAQAKLATEEAKAIEAQAMAAQKAKDAGKRPLAPLPDLVAKAQALLTMLESGRGAAGRHLPEELLAFMTALQQTVLAIAPPLQPAFDEALESKELYNEDDHDADGDADMDSRVENMLTRLEEVHVQQSGTVTARDIVKECLIAFASSSHKGKGKGDSSERFEPR